VLGIMNSPKRIKTSYGISSTVAADTTHNLLVHLGSTKIHWYRDLSK
jgi:hypothetical protein